MDDRAFIARFAAASAPRPHPGIYHGGACDADWSRFGTVLEQVGGRLLPVVRTRQHLVDAVSGVIAFAPGRTVAARAAEPLLAGVSDWTASGPDGDPRQYADVQLGILVATVAVTENAALLFHARSLPERTLALLPQYLLVLIPEHALVGSFGEAQSALAEKYRSGPDSLAHHVTWISGPSKTADIEQTLVIGAHGTRSLTVLPYSF